jgi:hypothetical protein
MTPSPKQCSTPQSFAQGATSIAFEENQLSPSLFSLSLLATPHPHLLQQMWVRASTSCYRSFTLDMASSPGFGSIPSDLTPSSDSVSLRLPYSVKLATKNHSLTHYTKGTQSPVTLITLRLLLTISVIVSLLFYSSLIDIPFFELYPM